MSIPKYESGTRKKLYQYVNKNVSNQGNLTVQIEDVQDKNNYNLIKIK